MTHPLRPQRLLETMAGLSEDAPDDRVLRRRLLEAIGRLVPHEHYAFVTTDPETAVGCSPLAEVPDLQELPQLIRLKYLTHPGRWTALPATGCSTLLRECDGDLSRSAQWAGALRGHGVRDVLLAVLRDRQGTWGFLDLWRTSGPFRDDEVAAVRHALPAMTALLRSAVAQSFARTAGSVPAPAPWERADKPRHPPHPSNPSHPTQRSQPSQAGQAGQAGPGVLLLADDLAAVAGTPQLHAWLAALLPPAAGVRPVPASALNVAAQLLAVEAGVDGHHPRGRLALSPGVWLTVRADRLAEPVPGASIAVGYEVAGPADRLEVFVRAHGLSARERDVVRAVAAGLDTRGAGRHLGITELTVQDHLKGVFARTGAVSRADLLARALGT